MSRDYNEIVNTHDAIANYVRAHSYTTLETIQRVFNLTYSASISYAADVVIAQADIEYLDQDCDVLICTDDQCEDSLIEMLFMAEE